MIMKTYCLGCDKEMSMVRVLSFTDRFPDLVYCSSCLRAYNTKTGDPLSVNGKYWGYFDRDFIDYDEDGKTIIMGALVGRRKELSQRL